MKRFVMIGLAVAAIPGLALAQSSPPPPSGSGMPAPGAGAPAGDRSAMRAMRRQMADIRRAGRTAVLAALSSAHRSLVASIVGELAVAPAPDVEAAAKRIDAALSPAESTAVIAAAGDMRERMRAAMAGMRAHAVPEPEAPRPGMPDRPAATAGSILIRTAIAFDGPPRGMPR